MEDTIIKYDFKKQDAFVIANCPQNSAGIRIAPTKLSDMKKIAAKVDMRLKPEAIRSALKRMRTNGVIA